MVPLLILILLVLAFGVGGVIKGALWALLIALLAAVALAVLGVRTVGRRTL